MFAHLYHLMPEQWGRLDFRLVNILLEEADAWINFQSGGEPWHLTGGDGIAAADAALTLDPRIEVVDVSAG